jgi:hypothetical protein
MDQFRLFSIAPTYETNVFLVASHHGERQDGVAAGAYFGTVHGNGLSGDFWGSGGVRNTETLFAYGIADVIEAILVEDDEAQFPLHIFIHNNGVRRHLMEYVPCWITNGNLNSRGSKPDAFEQWKHVYLLHLRSKIILDNVRPSTFPHYFRYVQGKCDQLAKAAFDRKAFRQVGVFDKFQGRSIILAKS